MHVTFVIVGGFPPKDMVCFAHDKDVLRAVFHAVNERKVAGARTERLQQERRAWIPAFERFASIDVQLLQIPQYSDPVHKGRWALHIAMKLQTFHPSPDWWCQLFADDWTIHRGLSRVLHQRLDGIALVPSRARVKWNALRRRMLGLARALVVFGNALEEVRLRPDGSEYHRVKARFELMAAAPDACV